jgi:hypothetical protein
MKSKLTVIDRHRKIEYRKLARKKVYKIVKFFGDYKHETDGN